MLASKVVNSRLVIIATGKDAIIRKGLRLPNLVLVPSDLNPTIGPHIASQMEPMAVIVPAMAGLIPATVVRNSSRYVPDKVYIALSQIPPIP